MTVRNVRDSHNSGVQDDFVLEKSIFNNIFEKDIRRVFIYKKAERLAKAVRLIAPAFSDSASFRNKVDSIAIGLVDAGVLPAPSARQALSRELLALSSVLSIARTGGLLSSMNADLIAREVHTLLQEIAAYEEPRLSLDEVPSLSNIAKSAQRKNSAERVQEPSEPKRLPEPRTSRTTRVESPDIKDERVITDNNIKDRQEAILSVIRSKGTAGIKDISTVVRSVSEKTIQRELVALVQAGIVRKQGERRWSTYSIA